MFNLKAFFQRLGGARAEPETNAQSVDDLRASWLIVGLGNPGDRYAATRHNVGYMATDDLLAPDGEVLAGVRGVPATVAQVTVGEQTALVVRSTTFMNNSGEAVAPLARALGVPAERVIVAHDELDLPAGKIRLRLGGNENGHNGLKSISEHLGTRDYVRVRIGIARPPKGMGVSDYVLGPVESGTGFDEAIATAAQAASLVVTDGLSKAQNAIHARR